MSEASKAIMAITRSNSMRVKAERGSVRAWSASVGLRRDESVEHEAQDAMRDPLSSDFGAASG